MMKKRIRIMAVICLIAVFCAMFAACGSAKHGKCELCGKEADLKKVTISGESGWVCDDCAKTVEALGDLADLFG